MDVDHGQLVYRSLKDVPVIVRLHELAPVGGRAAGGRHRWRFERFASGQCCKPLPSVDSGMCDDYIGKQPPAGFDAWCLWPEWLRGHKPR